IPNSLYDIRDGVNSTFRELPVEVLNFKTIKIPQGNYDSGRRFANAIQQALNDAHRSQTLTLTYNTVSDYFEFTSTFSYQFLFDVDPGVKQVLGYFDDSVLITSPPYYTQSQTSPLYRTDFVKVTFTFYNTLTQPTICEEDQFYSTFIPMVSRSGD